MSEQRYVNGTPNLAMYNGQMYYSAPTNLSQAFQGFSALGSTINQRGIDNGTWMPFATMLGMGGKPQAPAPRPIAPLVAPNWGTPPGAGQAGAGRGAAPGVPTFHTGAKPGAATSGNPWKLGAVNAAQAGDTSVMTRGVKNGTV